MFQEILVCLFFFFKLKCTLFPIRGKFEDFRTAPFMETNECIVSCVSGIRSLNPEGSPPACAQDLPGYPRPKRPFPLSCYRVTELAVYY